jgi:phosphoglycerate dehydrogenase-like enzyme
MSVKAVFLAQSDNSFIRRVYDETTRSRLGEKAVFHPEFIHPQNAAHYADELREVEAAFSTWGIPDFSEEALRTYFPNLKALFYAAGSVQRFARPFLSRGITVMSSWAANAVPVAEYVAAQILLANKGYFLTSRLYKQDNYTEAKSAVNMYPGNYKARVGIIGTGMVGRRVIGILRNYYVDIDVFDPFLSDSVAEQLGVRKTDLYQIFSHCDTISNHLANLSATVGMLNKEHFDRMLPHATFINTGRGAQVVEEDLIRALKEVPTRSAVLDVTNPEPVDKNSELLRLNNVILTPHIAGSLGREVARMGIYAADEFERYIANEPFQYQVTEDMLATMA